MQNGYFQIICNKGETALKVFPPKDGGAPVAVRETVGHGPLRRAHSSDGQVPENLPHR